MAAKKAAKKPAAKKAAAPAPAKGGPIKFERIETGVPGLDKLIQGGIPKGNITLVSGGTGCGKTTFGAQFIWHGLQIGENGLYITLEQSPEEIKGDISQFGWDVTPFEKSGKVRIVYYDPFELGEIINRMKDLITINKIQRLVIDSASLFGLYVNDDYKIRQKLYKLVQALKKTGCTTILLSEIEENSKTLSRFGVEEFVADGVIVLYYLGIGEGVFRNIEVRKMRRTRHANGTFPLVMDKKGLTVKASESLV